MASHDMAAPADGPFGNIPGPLRVAFGAVDLHNIPGRVRVWEHPDGGVVVDVPASPIRFTPRTARQFALHVLALAEPGHPLLTSAEKAASELATCAAGVSSAPPRGRRASEP